MPPKNSPMFCGSISSGMTAKFVNIGNKKNAAIIIIPITVESFILFHK